MLTEKSTKSNRYFSNNARSKVKKGKTNNKKVGAKRHKS